MTIGGTDVVAAAKATAKGVTQHDLQGAAAEVAYNVIFAMVPMLIFLTAVSGVVARSLGLGEDRAALTDWLFHQSGLPPATAAVLQGPIEQVIESQAGGLLSLGLLLSLWGAKNAVASLMKGLNRAHGVTEGRPWWRHTAVALGLTVALGAAFSGASAAVVLGDLFGRGASWGGVWDVLRVALAPALLVLGLAVLYWVGPDTRAPFRWLSPGSVLAVLLWVAATYLLRWYFAHAADYVTTYGVLGGLLALIFWLYVMSFVLLLGGQLDAVLAPARDAAPDAAPTPAQLPSGSPAGPLAAARGRLAAFRLDLLDWLARQRSRRGS